VIQPDSAIQNLTWMRLDFEKKTQPDQIWISKLRQSLFSFPFPETDKRFEAETYSL